MGRVIEIHADLLESELPAIGHGVNVKGVMGAGIAAAFARRYPDMKLVYERSCQFNTFVAGQIMPWQDPDTKQYIMNLATQVHPGRNAQLEYVSLSMNRTVAWLRDRGVNVLGLPQIGCGIGGLVWEDVRAVIERRVELFDFTVVVCRWP